MNSTLYKESSLKKKKPLAELGSGRSSHDRLGNEEEEREEKRSRETINSKQDKLATAGERRQKLMTHSTGL